VDVVLLVPSLVALMLAVGRHYRRIELETAAPGRLKLENLQEPIVIVPIIDWSSIAENGLRFAMTLSSEVEVLHIESEDTTKSLKRIWPTRVEEPAREAKQAVPLLTVLKSPFRFVVQPIIDHVLEVGRKNPDRTIRESGEACSVDRRASHRHRCQSRSPRLGKAIDRGHPDRNLGTAACRVAF
jgi:hypothetical protein